MYKEPSSMGILMDPQDLANYMGNKGIDFSKELVLYDDGSNKYAGRVFWTLKYLGVKNVKILIGHFDVWFNKNYPVTKNPTPFTKCKNKININEDIFVDTEDVKSMANKQEVLLIDVRSKSEHKDIGHIPGSMQFYWESVLDMKKNFRNKDYITSYAHAAGIDADKTIVLYCNTSVKASVMYFALKEVAQFPHVKIYDGAFKEWASYSLPIAN
jgi:thiosulfate/3-mercaptopyruvate sulfurtransferase